MQVSKIFRLAIVASLSCVTAACQSVNATNGSGYQMTKFANARAAILASQDELAGPAINSNNRQCEKDKACRK